MNLWTIAILFLVVALVVGPIMMMQPSPRSRREAGLRARASAYGMHVSLEALPRQATDLEEPPRSPMYCLNQPRGRAAPRWLLVRGTYEHDYQFLGWWRWQSEARPTEEELDVLQGWLPELPESVQGVGANAKGWYVYWTEQGGEPVLERLAEGLGQLKDCIRPPASAPD